MIIDDMFLVAKSGDLSDRMQKAIQGLNIF